MKTILTHCKRIVVKVGSSLVTNQGAGLDAQAIASWAQQIAALRENGCETVLVSSGAIAEGMQRLGWKQRPSAVHELQAAAAVGQMGLVQVYESCFRKHGLRAAQVLLTHADQQGLYSADPRKDASAKLLEVAQVGDSQLESIAGGAGSHIGRGGMITKVLAAKRAARSGAHTVIASGHERDVLPRLLRGENIGTLLIAPQMRSEERRVG